MKGTKEMYPLWGDDHSVRLGNVKSVIYTILRNIPFTLWRTLRCLNWQRVLRIREYLFR